MDFKELNLYRAEHYERQPGDRTMDQTKSIFMPSNRTEQNQTGLLPDWTWRNWISALNVKVGRTNWTFLVLSFTKWDVRLNRTEQCWMEGLVGFDVACVAYNGVFVLMISCSSLRRMRALSHCLPILQMFTLKLANVFCRWGNCTSVQPSWCSWTNTHTEVGLYVTQKTDYSVKRSYSLTEGWLDCWIEDFQTWQRCTPYPPSTLCFCGRTFSLHTTYIYCSGFYFGVNICQK